MNCQEAQELIERMLDGELDRPEAERFEAHLTGCVECSALYAAEKSLDEALAFELSSHAPSQAFRANVRRAVAGSAPGSVAAMLGDALNGIGLAVCAGWAQHSFGLTLGLNGTFVLLGLGACALLVLYPALVLSRR